MTCPLPAREVLLPLYAFVRHQGHPQHDAEDLTQGFFADLLDRDGQFIGTSVGRADS